VKSRARDARLRLIGYARVSTEEQVAHGVSLQAQSDRLNAHALAHGYDLTRVEVDEGISGKTPPDRRPALRRALDAVRRREADGIVFLKLDRLSRSVRDILKLADEAKRKGWHIVSMNEHIDTSTAAGKFTLGVLALLAEMERDQVSERTLFGMNHVAREGRARSRFLPFGFRVEGAPDSTVLSAGDRRPLVEHPEEALMLRRMLLMNKQGAGAQKIANGLNADGASNPRTGRPWTTSTVAAILRTVRRRSTIHGNRS
jgi:site-specific DNA recombinase